MSIYGIPPSGDGETSRIEVEFAIPVNLTDKEVRTIADIVNAAARRHQPEGWVHWQSGIGSKPNFSQADCRFLGKEVKPGAPISGEPTWDDSVLHIETTAREKHPGEK